MPQKVGTVSTELQLDTRRALQQYNRFQQSVQRGGRSRDSLFGAISGDAKEFENSLGKATNRVVAFGAAAAIFTGVARATSEFARSIVEVDKQLAAINVNLGQSTSGLKKFGADLFNVARQTGQTFEVAATAAAELARQGLSAEETTKRLKDVLILSRIAGLDSASAVDTLTAAINSFNQEALTSTEVVNKFAAVDTKFAVSSKDLAEAVSRVGSTAQTAGVGINELIGLVTSLQQTTARGGATIGNGLKTIFTRIQAAPETVNALQGIGVAIKNTDGSLRDGISILKDYAVARQKVGEVERQALDRTVAGTFQINVLKALLGDLSKEYSVYGNAVRTATGATDEAIRKNAQLNETIASLLNSTGLSIKQLFSSIGEQSLGPVFQGLLKNLEQVRAFFSGDSGNELGKSLGSGILSGISNVLSGPALVALTIILVNAFKKVVSTISQEARTLLSINGVVQARANIQKQIIDLLERATQAERAQYHATTSVLAKKEQLLALEARINQERLAGNAVANSFLVSGPLGMGFRKDPKLRGGYIGGFADPVASAIAREQKVSGLSKKDIYIDRDPRVANFGNPLGVLVANKRDEPLGGFQGVNRVIAEGGNPKTAGMTPNFASPEDTTRANRLMQGVGAGGTLRKSQIDFLRKVITDDIVKQKLGQFGNVSSQVLQQNPTLAKEIESSVNAQIKNITKASATNLARKLEKNAEKRITDVLSVRTGGLLGGLSSSGGDIPALKSQFGRSLSSAERKAYKTLSPVFQEIRSQKRSNIALGSAFALPFAAGFVPKGQGGTLQGAALGAASGALQGAGIGGIFGPVGLAVGGGLGALVGAISKATQSFDELDKELGEARATETKRIDQISTFAQIQGQLNDALETGDLPLARKLSSQRDLLLRSKETPLETRQLIAKAGGDPKALQALISSEQAKTQRNSIGDDLTKSLKEFNDFGSNVLGRGDDEIKSLISAITNQADASGINLFRQKTDRREGQALLLSRLGASKEDADKLISSGFFFRILKEAASKQAENSQSLDAINKKLKEFETTISITSSMIRRAQMNEALSGTRTRGGTQRNFMRDQFAVDELSGLATTNQAIGLRGRLEVSQAINSGGEERRKLESTFRAALQKELGAVGNQTMSNPKGLSLEQRGVAFSSNTSIEDLRSLALDKMSSGEDTTLGNLIRDFKDALEQSDVALKDNIKTIQLKTKEEQKAIEIIRRQTSFSQGSLVGGSDAARGLRIIGTPGERTPRKQITENAALVSFYEQQRDLGGDVSALQGGYNAASAKTNREKFLAEAEEIIRSLTMSQGRARDEAGNLSESAVRQAAGTLSRYKDPNKASVGRYLLDNLQAQAENVTAAGVGQGRIKTALSGEQNMRPEEAIKKQLEASTALQKNLEAFNSAAKDFTINVNAKVEVLNDGIGKLQEADFVAQLQAQFTSLFSQVMNDRGTPVPPTFSPPPSAPPVNNRVTAYAPSATKKLVKGPDGYYR